MTLRRAAGGAPPSRGRTRSGSNYNRPPTRRGRLAGDSDDSVPVHVRDGEAEDGPAASAQDGGSERAAGSPSHVDGGTAPGAGGDGLASTSPCCQDEGGSSSGAEGGIAVEGHPSPPSPCCQDEGGSGAEEDGRAAEHPSTPCCQDEGGGGAEEGGAGTAGGEEPAPDSGEDMRSRLRDAEARAAGLDAQLRRALADYRNLERRARADIDAAVRERVARFAADMISVRDDFERAAKAAAGGAQGAEAVSAGLDTVLRGMDSALSKHGVAPIEAIGEIFDPHRHEAVATVEDAALDEGTITAEAARGYSLDERIIRPSRVVISKKPATKEADA